MDGRRESCGLFHHQRHGTEMDFEMATLQVLHITLQGLMDHRESQTLPWDLVAREKLHVGTLMPNPEIRAAHLAAKNHIDLIDTHEAENGIEIRDLYLSLGFLQSLSGCCLFRGFIEFHEAGGKRPQAQSWFNGPAAQKDLTFPFRKAACDDLRILVMDRLAGLAHKPQQGLPGRNFQDNRFPTLTAILHQ